MLLCLFNALKGSQYYIRTDDIDYMTPDDIDENFVLYIHQKNEPGTLLNFYYMYFTLNDILINNNNILVNRMNTGYSEKLVYIYRELGDLLRIANRIFMEEYEYLIDAEELGLI